MESFLDISILKEKIIKTDRVLQMYMEVKKKYSDLMEKYKQSSSELSLMKLDIEVKTLQLSEQREQNEKLTVEHNKLGNDYSSLRCNYNKQLDELVSLQMKYQTLCRDLNDYRNDDKKLSPKDPQNKKKVKKRKSLLENTTNENLNETSLPCSQSSDDKKNFIKIEILDGNNSVEDYLFPGSIDCSPLSEESGRGSLLEDFREQNIAFNTQGPEMESKFKRIIEDLQVNIEEQNNIFQKKFQEKENEINRKWEEKQKELKSEIKHLSKKIEDDKVFLTESYEKKISTLKAEWKAKEGRLEAEIINSRLKNDEEVSRLIKNFEAKEANMRQERLESEMKLRSKISNLEEQLKLFQEKTKDNNSINAVENRIQKSGYEPEIISSDCHFGKNNSNAIETEPMPINSDDTDDSDIDFNMEDIFKEMRVTMLSPIPELILDNDEVIVNSENNVKSTALEEKRTEFRKNNISDISAPMQSKTQDWSNRYQVNRKKKIAKYKKLSEIKKAKQKFWLELGQTINLKKPIMSSYKQKETNSAEKNCMCVSKITSGCCGFLTNVQPSMEKERNKITEIADQPKIIQYFSRLSKNKVKTVIEKDHSDGVGKNEESTEIEKETAIIDEFCKPYLFSQQEKQKREIIVNGENELSIAANKSKISENQTEMMQCFSVNDKDQPNLVKGKIEIEEPVNINDSCKPSVDQNNVALKSFSPIEVAKQECGIIVNEENERTTAGNSSKDRESQPDVVQSVFEDQPDLLNMKKTNIEDSVHTDDFCKPSVDRHNVSEENFFLTKQKEQKREIIENGLSLAGNLSKVLENQQDSAQSFSLFEDQPNLGNTEKIGIEESVHRGDFCKSPVDQDNVPEENLFVTKQKEQKREIIENILGTHGNFSKFSENQPDIAQSFSLFEDQTNSENTEKIENEESVHRGDFCKPSVDRRNVALESLLLPEQKKQKRGIILNDENKLDIAGNLLKVSENSPNETQYPSVFEDQPKIKNTAKISIEESLHIDDFCKPSVDQLYSASEHILLTEQKEGKREITLNDKNKFNLAENLLKVLDNQPDIDQSFSVIEDQTNVVGNMVQMEIEESELCKAVVDQHKVTLENISPIEQKEQERKHIENEGNELDMAGDVMKAPKNHVDIVQSFSLFKDQPDVNKFKENIKIEEKPVIIDTARKNLIDQHIMLENSLDIQSDMEEHEINIDLEEIQPDTLVNFSEFSMNPEDVVQSVSEIKKDQINVTSENKEETEFEEPMIMEKKIIQTEKYQPDNAVNFSDLPKKQSGLSQFFSEIKKEQTDVLGENKNIMDIKKGTVTADDFLSYSIDKNITEENFSIVKFITEEQGKEIIETEDNQPNIARNFSEFSNSQQMVIKNFSDLRDQFSVAKDNLKNIESEDEPEIFEDLSSNSIDQQAKYSFGIFVDDLDTDIIVKSGIEEKFSVTLKNLLNVITGEHIERFQAEDTFDISENLKYYCESIRESCSYSRKYELTKENVSSDDDSLMKESLPKTCKRKRPIKGKLMTKSLKVYNLRSCATTKVNNYKENHTPEIISNNKKRENPSHSMVDSPKAKRRKSSSTVYSKEITRNDEKILPMAKSSFSPSISSKIVDTKKEVHPIAKQYTDKLIENNKFWKMATPSISNEPLVHEPEANDQMSHTTNNKSNIHDYQEKPKVLASQLDPSKINIIQNLILRPKGKFFRTGGFKRPLSTKILPACPQSPPLSEVQTTNFVEPAVIIPLEKPAELKPGVVRTLFKKLITYSTEDKTVEEVGKEFANQEPEYISRCILQQIIMDKDKPDAAVGRAPLMTHTQRVMLGFMLKLEKMKVFNLINTYLKMSELYLIHTKILSSIEPLARFHVAICKAHGYLERMRKFCVEAFYFMDDLAIPFFFTVLVSWIEILPPANISEGFPIVRVLIQLVHLKSCNKPGYNLLPLRDLLHKYYQYPSEPWNSDNFFKELFNNYLKNPVAPADLPIILYCKNNTCKWVCQKIETLIKPVLPNVNENFKATLIILIGNIMFHFHGKNNQEHIKPTKDWLEDILKDEDTSEIVKKSVRYTLNKIPKILQLPGKTESNNGKNVHSVDKNCDM